MFKVCTILLLLGAAAVNSQEDFQAYNVQAKNQFQKDVLFSLEATNNYHFVELTRIVDEVETVLVPNHLVSEFENIISKNKIISKKVKPTNFAFGLLPGKKDKLKNGQITYDGYYPSDLIDESIGNIAKEATSQENSPLRVEPFQYGQTYLEKPLIAYRISHEKNDASSVPTILVDAGIHGNEWVGPAAAHFIVENLLTTPEGLEILENFNIVLTPCVNKDGYDSSIDYTYPIFYGRKNLQPSETGHKCILKLLEGQNINRNFPWFWNSTDSKEDPCGYNYRGDYPLSAPEAFHLSELMKDVQAESKLVAYLTIHSFGNVILYPFGNSRDKVNFFEQNNAVALAAKEAVEAEFGEPYRVGSTIDVLYVTTGASKDYACGELGIPICLIHEIGGRKLDFQPLTKGDLKKYIGMAWTVFRTEASEIKKYQDILLG